jgi:hypothetical protein
MKPVGDCLLLQRSFESGEPRYRKDQCGKSERANISALSFQAGHTYCCHFGIPNGQTLLLFFRRLIIADVS